MQDDNETTRRRAYAIWEAEGRPEGRDREHWAQAETEGRPGLAEAQQPYSSGEQPGPGAPDRNSGLPEAEAQAGEGVPDPDAGRPLAAASDAESDAMLAEGGSDPDAGRPLAATPDAESEAMLAEGSGRKPRGGQHTGP